MTSQNPDMVPLMDEEHDVPITSSTENEEFSSVAVTQIDWCATHNASVFDYDTRPLRCVDAEDQDLPRGSCTWTTIQVPAPTPDDVLDDETTCYVTFIVHGATVDNAAELVGDQWEIDTITTQAEEDERTARIEELKDAAGHMVLVPTMGNLARLADAARAMGVDI